MAKIGTATRGNHHRDHHGRDDGQQRVDQVDGKGFQTQPAHLRYVIKAAYRMDDRDENQGYHQHFDHGHEHSARSMKKATDQKGLNSAVRGREQLNGCTGNDACNEG